MTELEMKLLNELESLEKEREAEQERMKKLSIEYEKSIKRLSEDLTQKYQESLIALMQEENTEEKSLLAYLKTLTEQNQQIITLLQQPSEAEPLKEQLEEVLQRLFNGLQTAYSTSNKKLLSDLSALLKE